MRVLFVDEDRDLADLLSFTLKRAGLEPVTAFDFASALSILAEQSMDLVVLDPAVPVAASRDPILEIKRRYPTLPVIILSVRAAERDKVDAFERGADDYVTKPFSHRELVARIRARLRARDPLRLIARAPQPAADTGLILDGQGQQVLKDGQPLPLSSTELRLMRVLMANAGTVVPRHLLANHVSGGRPGAATETLRVVLHRLRKKLVDAGLSEDVLQTVSGVGVKFVPAESSGSGAARKLQSGAS